MMIPHISRYSIEYHKIEKNPFVLGLIRVIFLITIVILFLVGMVVIFSATSAEALDHAHGDHIYSPFIKQMLYALVGVVMAGLLGKIGFYRLLKSSPILFWMGVGMLFLALIPGIGYEANGSKRWILVGHLSIQPSEIMKMIIPLYFVARVDQLGMHQWDWGTFLKLIGNLLIPVFLTFLEPNNGTAFVMIMVITLMCFLYQIPYRFWMVPLLILGLIGGVLAVRLPYVSSRLQAYWHPEKDLRGKGHQSYQAKIAAGSGRLLGKGPGNSWQKLSYLPEAQNDYIAAIFAEEYGYLGILGLISCYLIIAISGYAIAIRSLDLKAGIIAMVITFLIVFQAFLNLGVVSGLLPSTGLNLPFFSQGGSSLLANIFGVTLLLVAGNPNCNSCEHSKAQ